MITHLKSAKDNERSETLLVFLPGAYLKPDEFEREGFINAVRERHLAADSLLVDADVSYYYDQTLSERLHADVIEPQRAKGYKSIWLVGISIGGFGALIHELSRPGSVDGIVALAPYLGRRVLGAEIIKAGGLRAWQAPSGPLPDEEVDRKLWPDALPEGRVFTTEGGHDWPQWRQLWRNMLDVLPVPSLGRSPRPAARRAPARVSRASSVKPWAIAA